MSTGRSMPALSPRTQEILALLPASSPVRVVTTPEERQQIYRFRYQVYVEEMGKAPSYADHASRTLSDALDESGVIFFLSDAAGQVVATFRMNFCDCPRTWESCRQLFEVHTFTSVPPEQAILCSRLMVAPSCRQTRVLGDLLEPAYELSRQKGVQIGFLQCRPCLVHLYELMGFRRFRSNIIDPDAGYQVPMAMVFEDLPHLVAVRSPFGSMAARYPYDAARVEPLRERLGSGGRAPESVAPPEELWRYLTLQLHTNEIPLFRGLTQDQIVQFLRSGAILPCKAGDHIVRDGEPGLEMYLLLSGEAEVRRILHGMERTVAVFQRGQVFGEMALLGGMKRTASVVACTDLEVLILSERQLQNALKAMPDITARVLFNLSFTLCERLRETTARWLEAIEEGEASAPSDDTVVAPTVQPGWSERLSPSGCLS